MFRFPTGRPNSSSHCKGAGPQHFQQLHLFIILIVVYIKIEGIYRIDEEKKKLYDLYYHHNMLLVDRKGRLLVISFPDLVVTVSYVEPLIFPNFQ